MIQRYRKKSVEIEAIQLTDSNTVEVFQFVFGEYPEMDGVEYASIEAIIIGNNGFNIVDSEGEIIKASIGDYIVKGEDGEFYTRKSDIFEQTHEPIND